MRTVEHATDATGERDRFEALPARVREALGELAGAAKEGLLALSVGVGLGVLAELMDEEVDEVVGPKGRHDSDRSAVRHGHEAGEVTLGGRRVGVERPRVRAVDGSGEVPLRTYRHFADRDPWTGVVFEQMLAGVSTRRFSRTREPVGQDVAEAERSTSESAVSREFVGRTREHLLAVDEPPPGRRAPCGADARRDRSEGPLLRRGAGHQDQRHQDHARAGHSRDS
jgi:putative transposase